MTIIGMQFFTWTTNKVDNGVTEQSGSCSHLFLNACYLNEGDRYIRSDHWSRTLDFTGKNKELFLVKSTSILTLWIVAIVLQLAIEIVSVKGDVLSALYYFPNTQFYKTTTKQQGILLNRPDLNHMILFKFIKIFFSALNRLRNLVLTF